MLCEEKSPSTADRGCPFTTEVIRLGSKPEAPDTVHPEVRKKKGDDIWNGDSAQAVDELEPKQVKIEAKEPVRWNSEPTMLGAQAEMIFANTITPRIAINTDARTHIS
jgi:hypothetical protein